MLLYETVESHTLELLKRIMGEPLFSDMRLVGGTALALQYGHRRSVDLDIFGSMTQDAEKRRWTSTVAILFNWAVQGRSLLPMSIIK